MTYKFEDSVYYSVIGKDNIAGPGYIIAIKFISQKKPFRYQTPDNFYESDLNTYKKYLDFLEEGKDYLMENITIPYSSICLYGFNKAVNLKLTSLLSKLSSKWKAKHFIFCNTDNNKAGSLYFEIEKARPADTRGIYCSIHALYTLSHRMTNLYHVLYPQYKFDKNRGRLDEQHLRDILEYGFIPRLHRPIVINRLLNYWKRLVLNYDVWCLIEGNYLQNPPKWWKKLVVQGKFKNYFSLKDQRRINEVYKQVIEYKHKTMLIEGNPNCGFLEIPTFIIQKAMEKSRNIQKNKSPSKKKRKYEKRVRV
jgi:hypothetical protein